MTSEAQEREAFEKWAATIVSIDKIDQLPNLVTPWFIWQSARASLSTTERGGGPILRLTIDRKIGMYGSTYDGPEDARAYTFEHQPGNDAAWRLGVAMGDASKQSAGDPIDSGLNLLRALSEKGFGVFTTVEGEPIAASPIPPAAAALVGEAVDDLWFTDSAMPLLAMSGDAESDRTLKLHFRRPVTRADRDTLLAAINAYALSAIPPSPEGADATGGD